MASEKKKSMFVVEYKSNFMQKSFFTLPRSMQLTEGRKKKRKILSH